MINKKSAKHRTLWEDQKAAMLGSCGDFTFSPNGTVILNADEPIQCPHCGDFILLSWKVKVLEISETRYLDLTKDRIAVQGFSENEEKKDDWK